MFPSRFDLVVAQTVQDAVEAKVDAGEGGRFLAGGQSLLPMMKMRVAFPDTLIDINRIAGLDAIERANGHLHVGALVRHADVVASDATFGVLSAAAPWIADPLVRNRGDHVRLGGPLRPGGRLELGAVGNWGRCDRPRARR